MPIEERSELITTSKVAKILHIHINTVRRWSDQGILNPYRIGPRGDRRFILNDINNFLTTPQYLGPSDNKKKRLNYN